MIFDEPASAMDKESKLKFMNYLENIKDSKTIIDVTYDLDIYP